MGSELEVDEGLYVGGLDLNDDKDQNDDEECLDNEGTTGDETLCLVGEVFRHEMEHVAQKHEESHRFVGGAPLHEYLGLELVEYLMEHLFGDAEGRSTEEHPTSGNQVEGDDASQQRHEPVLLGSGVMLAGQVCQRAEERAEAVPYLVETEEDTVNTAPEDEVEGSTVPKTSEEHGHEEVEVLTELAVTVTSKGDVEIVLEPGGEADVPTAPELGDGLGLVRAVEVLGKLETEQEGNTYRHVGVAREVAVNLEGVAIDGKEILESTVEVWLVEDALDEVDGDVVGDDGFLEESRDDEEDACAEHLVGHEQGATYLWDEVTCPHDRTCHELGEKRDVEGIVEEPVEGTYVATIDIDGVTQRLEGEETDAHRQEDVTRLPRHIQQVGATDG